MNRKSSCGYATHFLNYVLSYFVVVEAIVIPLLNFVLGIFANKKQTSYQFLCANIQQTQTYLRIASKRFIILFKNRLEKIFFLTSGEITIYFIFLFKKFYFLISKRILIDQIKFMTYRLILIIC
jgi:hypothetical protein